MVPLILSPEALTRASCCPSLSLSLPPSLSTYIYIPLSPAALCLGPWLQHAPLHVSGTVALSLRGHGGHTERWLVSFSRKAGGQREFLLCFVLFDLFACLFWMSFVALVLLQLQHFFKLIFVCLCLVMFALFYFLFICFHMATIFGSMDQSLFSTNQITAINCSCADCFLLGTDLS